MLCDVTYLTHCVLLGVETIEASVNVASRWPRVQPPATVTSHLSLKHSAVLPHAKPLVTLTVPAFPLHH